VSALSTIGRRTCSAGLIGVPLLLLVGLVLWLLWVALSFIRGDALDWWPVVWGWGAAFFSSAILGMFGGHWNRRIANWWNGRGVEASRVVYIFTLSTAGPLPVFIVMVTRMRSDGVPGWLWVLAGLAVVLGIITLIDHHRLIGSGGPAAGKTRSS
jgi:hypothetical protein